VSSLKPEQAMAWAAVVLDLITRGIVTLSAIRQAFAGHDEENELKLLQLDRLYAERIAQAEQEKALAKAGK
jgi:hypothetical protein